MDWSNVTVEELVDALKEVEWSTPPRPLAEFFAKFTVPETHSKWDGRVKCNFYYWLLAEVRDSLPKELDFINEARNCEKCEDNFKKLSPELASQISLPHIFWEWSTSRVLTMEFMEGVNVTDVQAIKLLGLRPADVARLISQTFAEMMFRHVFIHCDPYAANMTLHVKPGTK